MRWDWDLNPTRFAHVVRSAPCFKSKLTESTLTPASTRYAVLAELFASECGGTGI